MIRVRTRKSLTAIITGATLLLAGCGQDSITAPAADSFSGQIILLPAAERPAHGLLGADEQSVTVLVSASEGGSVKMGRYTLDFPPGALSADTPITIRQNDPAAMIVEFEPHGIRFNKPVRASACVGDLVDHSSRFVGVAWMNDSTGKWESISKSDAGPVVGADLWHFSDYSWFEQ